MHLLHELDNQEIQSAASLPVCQAPSPLGKEELPRRLRLASILALQREKEKEKEKAGVCGIIIITI